MSGASGSATILGAALILASVGMGGSVAQPVPVSPSGVPEQIIPRFRETGVPAFSTPAGSGTFGGGGGQPGNSGAGPSGGGGFSAGGNAYDRLAAQPYGQTAIATAQRLGVSPNAVAAIAQAESGFRNVPTANGSSSATGPWQITSPTWDYFVNKYNLPYSSADRTSAEAQANVAPYIIRDYANAVEKAIGQPPTAAQVYGAFVMGPTPGGNIARAQETDALGNYVTARAMANNNMTSWSVGQFNAFANSRMGSAGSQVVTGG